MAQVVVTIAGRTYRMACEDGQERHLEALAFDIDSRLAGLKTNFGEIGEQRLVVMAALTVADELSEAKARVAALEQRIAAFDTEARDAREAQASREKFVAEALDGAAERIEGLARLLAGKV
ncbi:MAG: cell division protein ZapA [Hyphomicrobiales bacterium]|nr:cell division protein ZapA [Hyphomicrobiales bacterium]